MNSFVFRAFGNSKVFNANTHNEAMLMANRHFPLGSGVWQKISDSQWNWVEGNFFD
jgi:hypothetical protein